MTAKRFTLKHFESQDWAYDNNKPIHTKEMVDLLNELHEENEQLKQNIADWETSFDLLKHKNEQLKQLNIPLEEVIDIVLDYKGRVERGYYND